ncbi:MAG: hypothetical protein D6734_04900, partial [Candidatus Schekmanbacteria bacterium]
VFRLSVPIEKANTDYRIDVKYFTQKTIPERKNLISKFYCLTYSIAKFLARRNLPDITVEANITDEQGSVFANKGFQRIELKEASEISLFHKKFYVPPYSKTINVVFRIQSNFHSIHIKDIKIYPDDLSKYVYQEDKSINEINRKIRAFYSKELSPESLIKKSDEVLSNRLGKESADYLSFLLTKLQMHRLDIKRSANKLLFANKEIKEYLSRLKELEKDISFTLLLSNEKSSMEGYDIP